MGSTRRRSRRARSGQARPPRRARTESQVGEREAEAFSAEQREQLLRSEFAICGATCYGERAERLGNGAVEAFSDGGVSPASVHTCEGPGAFELPLAASWCAEAGRFAGIACLGAVIRGETSHYEHVCSEAARG